MGRLREFIELILYVMLIYLSIILLLAAEFYGPRLWTWFLLASEELVWRLTAVSEWLFFAFAKTLLEWFIAAVFP